MPALLNSVDTNRRLPSTHDVSRRSGGFFCRRFLVSLFLAWVGGLGLAFPALASSSAALSFSPGSFVKGATSTLTITLTNDAASPVAVSAASALTLPAGLTFTTSAASTTCAGLGVTASGGTLTLTGSGSIPAASGALGTCAITATVTSATENVYDVTLPAGFFTSGDGSNPPGAALTPTVTATDYQPVTIALRSTRGASTAGWPQNILNNLYSDNVLDFDPAQLVRMRFVLTNPNPVALTSVDLPFPDIKPLNVIPDSFIAGSTHTGDTGLSTGMASGCGGTLTVADYTVDFAARSKTFPATPITLSGATIPAESSCEFSFLARADVAGAGGNSFNVTLAFGGGQLTSAQGVTNATVNLSQGYTYSNYLRTLSSDSSGFRGDTGTAQLIFANGGQTSTQQPGSAVYWTVDLGITPDQASYNASAASCPPLNWNSAARQLEFPAGAVVPIVSCTYNVTFTADYTGPDAYTDARICAVPGDVTLPSGYTWPKGIAAPGCTTYRAVASTEAENAGGVVVAATLIDPRTGAQTDTFPGSRLSVALLQLTLTAPQGVTGYSLTSSTLGQDKGNLINYDPSLSYVPAAATTCSGGSVTATPNTRVFTASGIAIAAGGSCTVTVPVINGDNTFVPNFMLKTCDAVGTSGGVLQCSAGVDKDFSRSGGTYTFSHSLTPAKSSMTFTDKSTIYRLTLNKPAGLQPMEAGGPLTVDFAQFAGADMGLEATEIISNSCNAQINGASAPGPIAAASSVGITQIATPDADAQGAHGYSNAGGFDAAAFAASTCMIELKLTPSTPTAGTDTFNGLPISSYNFAVSTATATPVTTTLAQAGTPRLSYTLIPNPPRPVTLVKTFSPSNISAGDTSTMTVTIKNSITGDTIDLNNVSLTDNYPAGLVNASPLAITQLAKTAGSGTCGGDIAATAGGNAITLTNGVIGADTDCAFTVKVVALDPNGVTNTIPTRSFASTPAVGDEGPAAAAITLSASLGGVLQFDPATLSFDPVTASHNTSTLKVSVLNAFGATATGVNLSGVLGAGLVFDSATVTPDPANPAGCDLGTITASGGNFTMTGASIPGSGVCTFTLNVGVTAAPATPSAVLEATIAAGGVNGTVAGVAQDNAGEIVSGLTVLQPATIVVGKTVSGQPAGAPAGASYPVTLTCDDTGTLSLNVTTATPARQAVRAGDSCTVAEAAKPAAVGGYHWETETVTPGAVPTAAAGEEYGVTIDNPLALNDEVTLSGTVSFDLDIGAGTPPDLTLTCTPAATSIGTNTWTAPQGASCTLGVSSNGAPPQGYTLGSVSYGGAEVDRDTGNFTVPSTDKSDLSATVELLQDAASSSTATPIPALDARMLALLALLLGAAGWIPRYRKR